MVRIGPVAPFASGLSAIRTRAVITFATLAAGVGGTSPEVAIKPRSETPTAPEPTPGQGRLGGVPVIVYWEGPELAAATAGIGRRKLNVPRARSTATTRAIFPNKPAGRLPQRPGPEVPDGAVGLRTYLAEDAGVARTSTVNRKRAKSAYLAPEMREALGIGLDHRIGGLNWRLRHLMGGGNLAC